MVDRLCSELSCFCDSCCVVFLMRLCLSVNGGVPEGTNVVQCALRKLGMRWLFRSSRVCVRKHSCPACGRNVGMELGGACCGVQHLRGGMKYWENKM